MAGVQPSRSPDLRGQGQRLLAYVHEPNLRTIHQMASSGFGVPSGWFSGGGAPRDGQRRSSQTSSRRGVIIITNPECLSCPPPRRVPGLFLLFPFYSYRFSVRLEANQRVKVFMRAAFYSGFGRACTGVHGRVLCVSSILPVPVKENSRSTLELVELRRTSWATLQTWREPFWGRRRLCCNQRTAAIMSPPQPKCPKTGAYDH